jgi:hypothetical protein
VFYLVGERFFVMSFDSRVADALRIGLALRVPAC